MFSRRVPFTSECDGVVTIKCVRKMDTGQWQVGAAEEEMVWSGE
jgi:hypothetical protein